MSGRDDAGQVDRIDTTKPHPARAYDYYLGGKDNFAVDRELAKSTMGVWPTVDVFARENRAFMGRAVRFVADAGVRQFLDVGTGIPTSPNTYEIAQSVAPTSRVVYVDYDPIVLAHARAILVGDPRGLTAYVEADLRDPRAIIGHPDARAVLDFDQPIALLLVAILHFVPDDWGPHGLIASLLDALPPGSYLVASHITPEHDPASVRAAAGAYRAAGVPAQARDRDELDRLAFTGQGLTLVEPGVAPVSRWRPDATSPATEPAPSLADVSCNGGVAHKS